MKQVAPAPCPEWYADSEWNVSLWGAYAFTGTDNNRGSIDDVFFKAGGDYDRFLGGDHAWGGGLDAKYFFRRYFGIGIEGFGLAAHGSDTISRILVSPNSRIAATAMLSAEFSER